MVCFVSVQIVAMDESGTYEVERIINKRIKCRRVEYLIKWKNFDDDHNKWVLEKDLDCDEILQEFEEKNTSNKRQNKMINDDKAAKRLKVGKNSVSNNKNAATNAKKSNDIDFNGSIEIQSFNISQGTELV